MNMIDRMSRDELLVAIFFATPIANRFSDRAISEDATAAERGAALAWKACSLGDFSDDGLRAILRYWDARADVRLSHAKKEKLNKAAEDAYQMVFLNLADRATA